MDASSPTVSGFTITELMVVVAIAGILALIALPSFRSVTQSQEVKNATYELYAGLALARSEAIKRNNDVTFALQAVSVDFPSPTHDEYGWTITTSGGTTILNHPQVKGVAFTPNPTSATSVTFQRNGRPTSTAQPTFLIDAYGATTPYASCVKVGLSGMPSTYKPVNGAC